MQYTADMLAAAGNSNPALTSAKSKAAAKAADAALNASIMGQIQGDPLMFMGSGGGSQSPFQQMAGAALGYGALGLGAMGNYTSGLNALNTAVGGVMESQNAKDAALGSSANTALGGVMQSQNYSDAQIKAAEDKMKADMYGSDAEKYAADKALEQANHAQQMALQIANAQGQSAANVANINSQAAQNVADINTNPANRKIDLLDQYLNGGGGSSVGLGGGTGGTGGIGVTTNIDPVTGIKMLPVPTYQPIDPRMTQGMVSAANANLWNGIKSNEAHEASDLGQRGFTTHSPGFANMMANQDRGGYIGQAQNQWQIPLQVNQNNNANQLGPATLAVNQQNAMLDRATELKKMQILGNQNIINGLLQV